MSKALKIALMTDELGWHSSQLMQSFNARDCEVVAVSLPQCHFDSQGSGLRLPGFEEGLPDGVFVRVIPAGSLETITFYLDILHALQHAGVLVYNQATMIEHSVDKAMTSFLLAYAGISTPTAWSFVDWQKADEFVQRHIGSQRLVLKPVFGSQGKDLRLIDSTKAWSDAYRQSHDQEKVCYLQSFIESKDGSDWRVFVIDNKAVAGMRRSGRGWINNVACGAECVAAPLEDDMVELAERAVRSLGLFYGGVDLIRDRDDKLWIVEVNSIPAWKGLQGVSDICISDRLVEGFLTEHKQ